MGLVLDEFYSNLRAVAVSAATGEGIPELMAALDAAAAEYEEHYLPELQRRKVRSVNVCLGGGVGGWRFNNGWEGQGK